MEKQQRLHYRLDGCACGRPEKQLSYLNDLPADIDRRHGSTGLCGARICKWLIPGDAGAGALRQARP